MRNKTKVRTERRGTVILLVIAVLTLLAVLGTAYIVSARTERQGAHAETVATNMQFGFNGILNKVSTALLDPTFDSVGTLGGYDTSGQSGRAGRWYTIPEAGGSWGSTSANSTVSDERFLVRDLVPLTTGDMTKLTPLAYNASTGAFDLAYVAANGKVVDPSGAVDAVPNLLEFSDASNVRYRYWLRIIDTSRLANLNTGWPGSVNVDANGTYVSAYLLAGIPGAMNSGTGNGAMVADVVTDLHDRSATSKGRRGLSTINTLTPPVYPMTMPDYFLNYWQGQLLRYERPSDLIQLFDIADELELRSNDTRGGIASGMPYVCRPAALWPKTFAVNSTGSTAPARSRYTVSSWSREPRRYTEYVGTKYTVTPNVVIPGFSSAVWPEAPRRVSVNTPLGISTGTTSTPADYAKDIAALATAATNIATAMEAAGYTQQESRSFAANYLTYRWSGTAIISQMVGAVTMSTLTPPESPSFIDDKGICVRVSAATLMDLGGVSLSGDLTAEVAGKVYLGYLPQPFINEVFALESVPDPSGAPTTVQVDNCAVELYNPYPVALNLTGFGLRSNGGTDVDLTGQFIPANGYLLIVTAANGDVLDLEIDKNVVSPFKFASANLTLNATAGGKITLMRHYRPRNSGTLVYAPIDEYDYTNLVASTGMANTPTMYSVARSNEAAPAIWKAAIHDASASTRLTTVTPGLINANAGGLYVVLHDRVSGGGGVVPAAPLRNIGDFNRIMRLAHMFTADGSGLFTSATALSQQLDPIVNTPTASQPSPYLNMDFPGEARVHFDFKRIAGNFSNPTDFTGISSASYWAKKDGDPKAATLLEHLSFMDRASDLDIDIGGGPRDLNKIRLPGKINFNTADGPVLAGVPKMTDQLICSIINYRERRTDLNYGVSVGASFNYITTNGYQGWGIRSMGELLVPIAVGHKVEDSSWDPKTLDDRDKYWAQIYNYATLQSDVFVVYGYVEALRANTAASPAHDNAADWYSASLSDSLTTPGTVKNIRVAKRRFVAIIDRSTSNIGRVPFFDATGTYAIGNKVTSLTSGDVYLCIAPPPVGTAPPNSVYWAYQGRFTPPRVLAVRELPQ